MSDETIGSECFPALAVNTADAKLEMITKSLREFRENLLKRSREANEPRYYESESAAAERRATSNALYEVAQALPEF